MFYAVSKYQDTYTAKAKKDEDPYARGLYFDTEDEAKAFILDRAWKRVRACEKALVAAERGLKKCQKKFVVSSPSAAKDADK